MTDKQHWLPLTPESLLKAHELIKPYIHRTPVLTSSTLNRIASSPNGDDSLARPKINFFFKCENYQRSGAFKARGAFHSLLRLILTLGEEEVRRRGVATHSSGNHAQAVALAAATLGIQAHIVMPSISVPNKIAATKGYGANVRFSGSTTEEREEEMAKVLAETGAILIHPYDHPDTILGQGTMAIEFEQQVEELVRANGELSIHGYGSGRGRGLDAVITPLGGGGMNSGNAVWFSEKNVRVFGAEPSFQEADAGRRGLETGVRVKSVKSLTIADGLRTPVGEIPFSIISNPKYGAGVYAVTEEQIKAAQKLVIERMKLVVEPSAVVPLAVCLYNEDFRRMVEREAGEKGWNVGVVLSGGNTTIESLSKLFAA